MQAVYLVLLALGIALSVRERKFYSMWRSKPTQSPLSTALAQLVGTAGGIYLSLELLFSFLKLPEDWWSSSAFIVEPLAAASLVLAIVQPFVLRLWRNVHK
ncbi:hypothetical protein [Paradesulfitobacterium ferrireducens]|uniref:hypothetical protein n=1 Tax=Paradesulfitobacterium ferrireducens TaxID=2816476 RepID=UPI001A8FED16|nr:hypothetical protein [Paradesulfitobacterium ferrireducens]